MRRVILAAAALAAAAALPAAADPPDVCLPLLGGSVAVCHSGVDPLCFYGWVGDVHYALPTC